MRKVFCRASIALAVFAMFAGAPAVYAQDATQYDLESSLMKYILCYEAYKEAKQSENPEVRADLANYIKAYREAYAEYLQLLHEADLYQPDKKEMNPATDFNNKRVAHGGKRIKWAHISNDKERERIKNGIKAGKRIDEIMGDVKESLPKEAISEPEEPIELNDNDGIIYGNEGVNTSENAGGNSCGSDDDNVTFTSPNPPGNNNGNNNGNPYWNGQWGNNGNGYGNGGHGPLHRQNAGNPNVSRTPWAY